MKGIILAGGSGSRLYPMTQSISKQLIPVYDKPMIQSMFGDGSRLGLRLDYKIQEAPNGIAQAFTLGEEFIKRKDNPNDEVQDVCLILGDNIFYMGDQYHSFKKEVKQNEGKNATIFAYHVKDPQRFGVVEFNKDHKAISIEEKPANPKSNYALVGLYFYPSDVVEKAKSLKPSVRGEYEITDINSMYLEEGRLNVVPMRRGNAWLDAGTPDSLMSASAFVQIIEHRQGLKIACIEEIAYRRGFINDNQMLKIINELKDGCIYKTYLQKVYDEYHEFY